MTEFTYRRPALYPKQKAAIFNTARYSLVEASSKSGKTYGCIIWLAEEAMQGKPGWQYWWIAPTHVQARIAYRRLKRGLPARLYRANDSELTLTLTPTDTTIAFRTGEIPDNLYGEDVHAAVIDEASRVREEAWHAIRSTLTATRGRCRIIGNVKGRRNWAYRMARRAEAGEPDMEYHRITWADAVEAGVLDTSEIDDARRQLPEAVFRELYEAEPSDDEGNPFGIEAIRSCVAPLSTEPPAAWGWDLAKSVDWTVGIALDVQGHACRFSRWQSPWGETQTRIVRENGETPAYVDSTGVGDPIVEQLQRQAGNQFEPFRFSQTSKQQLMEGLASAIQRREIRFPDGPIAAELEAFEYQYTRAGVRYGAPEGMHDDCVCALALVVARRGKPQREWRAA